MPSSNKWIDISVNPPNRRQLPVWAWYKNLGAMVVHTAEGIETWKPYLTHWKKFDEDFKLPAMPNPNNTQSEPVDEAALAAWRKLNPDYGPDDVPPDSFIVSFRAGAAWAETKAMEEKNNPPF